MTVRPRPQFRPSYSKPRSTCAKSTLPSETLLPYIQQTFQITTRPTDQVQAQRLRTYTTHLSLISVYARVVYNHDYADLVCVFPPYLLLLVWLWTWGRVSHLTVLLILIIYDFYTRGNDRWRRYEPNHGN